MTLSFAIRHASNREFEVHLSNCLERLFNSRSSQITLFWSPVEDPDYRPGLSWLELLGEHVTQTKRTCRRFCTTFDSLESYARASDKFQGKPYCCVEVNEAGKLFYFRNHDDLRSPSSKHKEAA